MVMMMMVIMLMVKVTMVMCVLVVMKEEEFPGRGLDLVAPVIQVKRAAPPLPDGKTWWSLAGSPSGLAGRGQDPLDTQVLCPLHPDWKPPPEWLP